MYMDDMTDDCGNDSGLEPRGACDPTSSVTRCALAFMLR